MKINYNLKWEKMGVKMRYDKSIISQNKGFYYYFVTDLIFSFQSLVLVYRAEYEYIVYSYS